MALGSGGKGVMVGLGGSVGGIVGGIGGAMVLGNGIENAFAGGGLGVSHKDLLAPLAGAVVGGTIATIATAKLVGAPVLPSIGVWILSGVGGTVGQMIGGPVLGLPGVVAAGYAAGKGLL